MNPDLLEATPKRSQAGGLPGPVVLRPRRRLSAERRRALKQWCLARADEWFAQGELGAARDFLLHAAALDPRDADLWQTLGSVHYLLGEHARAGIAFVRAGRLRPHDARIFVSLALVHERLQQPGLALALAQHARQLAPHDPSVRLVCERLESPAGSVAGPPAKEAGQIPAEAVFQL
jgi:tetratricopeptide (TPR) repeat protein